MPSEKKTRKYGYNEKQKIVDDYLGTEPLRTPGLNVVVLVGVAATTVKISYFEHASPIAYYRICVVHTHFQHGRLRGQKMAYPEVNFFPVITEGDVADDVADRVQIGDPVYVNGKLRSGLYGKRGLCVVTRHKWDLPLP